MLENLLKIALHEWLINTVQSKNNEIVWLSVESSMYCYKGKYLVALHKTTDEIHLKQPKYKLQVD